MKRTIVALLSNLMVLSGWAADYYWVGGTGSWHQYATHWATASGGSTFYTSVPTANDNVFFDINSFTAAGQTVSTSYVYTMACLNMNWTGAAYNPTFTGPGTLNIYGSLTLISEMTISIYGSLNFKSTQSGRTITSAGKTFDVGINFDGVGGGWTLNDDFNAGSKNIVLENGSLITGGHCLTAGKFQSNNSNTRTIDITNSTIILSSTSTYEWHIKNTNLTLHTDNSTIRFTGSNGGMQNYGSGNIIYHNIESTDTGTGICEIYFNSTTGIIKRFETVGNGSVYGICSLDTVIIHQNATVTYTSNFNYARFGGLATLNNNQTFHRADFLGNASINGSVTADSVLLTAGMSYVIQYNKTLTINDNLSLSGNCAAYISIKSSQAGSLGKIFKASGTVTGEYLLLKDIQALGGASFIALHSISLGNNPGWTIDSPSSSNFYWIGGSGNWEDGTHWSQVSGGEALGCVPNVNDNVFFDNNSFTTDNQVVTILGDASGNCWCRNMTWSNTNFDASFNGGNTLHFYIAGHYMLSQKVANNYQGYIHFTSGLAGNAVYAAGQAFSNDVYFDGSGEYVLQDTLTVENNDIFVNNGSFVTQGYPVSCRTLTASNNLPRVIDLGTSVITLTGTTGNEWYVNTSNLTLISGTSEIIITGVNGGLKNLQNYPVTYYKIRSTAGTGTCNISNASVANTYYSIQANSNLTLGAHSQADFVETTGNLTVNGACNIEYLTAGGTATFNGTSSFHKAVLNGNGSINSNNTFDTLELSAGKVYTFENGKTQTIHQALIAEGNAGAIVVIQSSVAGQQAIFSKTSGSVMVSYVSLKDNKAQGGALFMAANSVDLGNNQGWSILAGCLTDLYWVGGTGDWSDMTHWSATSGGDGGVGVPTANIHVRFDENSFTQEGQTVTINGTNVLCHDLVCSSTVSHAIFSDATSTLSIYGSLILAPATSWMIEGIVNLMSAGTGDTLDLQGNSLLNKLYLSGSGSWIMTSDLSAGNATIYLNSGTLITQNHSISAGHLLSSLTNPRSLTLGSSTITLSASGSQALVLNTQGLTWDPGTSLFLLTGSNAGIAVTGASSIAFHDITFGNPSGTATLNAQGSFHDVTFEGNGTLQPEGSYHALTLHGNAVIQGLVNCETLTLKGNATFNNDVEAGLLILTAGKTYTLLSSKTLHVLDSVYCRGNSCQPILLQSSNPAVHATFDKDGGSVAGDWIQLNGIHTGSGSGYCAGRHSTDLGNNDGWIFDDAPGYHYGLPADTLLLPGQTLLLTTENFNGGLQCTWKDGSHDSTYQVSSTGIFWVEVDFGGGCLGRDTIIVIYATAPVSLAGTVSYKNNTNTPIANTVVLLMRYGSIVATDTSSTDGSFLFPEVIPGFYTLQCESPFAWGGVNAVDALLVLKHFTGIVYLEGLNLKAADVDGSTYINSIDALLISKRFVGLIGGFSITDWVYTPSKLAIMGDQNIAQPIKALCAGDLNGSYIP